ncbi:phosphoglucomutase [Paenibacillus sp. GCM10012307]|uniref:Phosphoglucomutase n=1 Tax=Paenibacillus roseus TaxID=2798579 RepID=A0A934IZA3_9BACL|nr:phosphoglucomutase [Paenibacillus roseus]MBJ6360434.1 phosphoglucomutase [Paenibacillus roseus]
MAILEKTDQFTEKLNKRPDGSMYVVEEEVELVNGSYEGYLSHSNVRKESIQCYTGPKLTGQKVDQVLLTTPSDAPWRLMIKIFSSATAVYITYETPGDQVDASHINTLQDSLVRTQEDFQSYKSNGLIDGGYFEK